MWSQWSAAANESGLGPGSKQKMSSVGCILPSTRSSSWATLPQGELCAVFVQLSIIDRSFVGPTERQEFLRQLLEDATMINPNRHYLHDQLARVHRKLGNVAEARDQRRLAGSLKPSR